MVYWTSDLAQISWTMTFLLLIFIQNHKELGTCTFRGSKNLKSPLSGLKGFFPPTLFITTYNLIDKNMYVVCFFAGDDSIFWLQMALKWLFIANSCLLHYWQKVVSNNRWSNCRSNHPIKDDVFSFQESSTTNFTFTCLLHNLDLTRNRHVSDSI